MRNATFVFGSALLVLCLIGASSAAKCTDEQLALPAGDPGREDCTDCSDAANEEEADCTTTTTTTTTVAPPAEPSDPGTSPSTGTDSGTGTDTSSASYDELLRIIRGLRRQIRRLTRRLNRRRPVRVIRRTIVRRQAPVRGNNPVVRIVRPVRRVVVG